MAKETKTVVKSGKGKGKNSGASRDALATKVVLAMTKPATLSELAKQADEMFVAGGDGRESNLAMQKLAVKRSLNTLEAAGMVKLTTPTDTIVERI